MAGDADKSLASGMNDHVTKPIDPAEMFAALVKWIKPRPGLGLETPAASRPVQVTADETTLPNELPGIDIKDGLGRVGGNTRLYREILVRLYADFADAHSEIGRLLSESQSDEAQRLAHSIKGVAGNIGAKALQAAAANVEAAIEGGSEEEHSTVLSALEGPLMEVIDGLSALAPEESEPIAELTPESFSSLPADLLDQMRAATASADMDRMEELIGLVEVLDATVAEGLRELVDNFEYDKLSVLLVR
jgi:HPt (histidine-containing phosphotransfer) domain-containing protein